MNKLAKRAWFAYFLAAAMLVGVLVFSEPFDLPVAAGVGLIVFAVTLVMVGPRLFQRCRTDS